LDSAGIVLNWGVQLGHGSVIGEDVGVQSLDCFLLKVSLVNEETQMFNFLLNISQSLGLIDSFEIFFFLSQEYNQLSNSIHNMDFLQGKSLIGICNNYQELIDWGFFAS
jgi:hypothetical protein